MAPTSKPGDNDFEEASLSSIQEIVLGANDTLPAPPPSMQPSSQRYNDTIPVSHPPSYAEIERDLPCFDITRDPDETIPPASSGFDLQKWLAMLDDPDV